MNAKWTIEDYTDAYGKEFIDALWNKSIGYRKIAQRFGVPVGTVFHIRRTIVPEEHRPTHRQFMKNPEFVDALKSTASSQDIADKFACKRSYINRCRIKVRGRVVKPSIRLSTSVLALLRSSLPNGVVARALDTISSVVTEQRKRLGVPIRKIKRVTPEQRSIIISAPSNTEASLETGVPYSTCRDVRRVHINLPRR